MYTLEFNHEVDCGDRRLDLSQLFERGDVTRRQDDSAKIFYNLWTVIILLLQYINWDVALPITEPQGLNL